MPALFVRGNDAVAINPADGTDFHLTEHGSDWLWAAFSLLALSTLVSVALSYTKPRSERLFYHINTIALLVMSVTYFTTASNLGWTTIQAEFNHVTVSNQTVEPGFRQIFYARFVGWFLAFPMVLVNYATLFSVDWSNLIFTVAAQWMTVIGLLIGSLIKSTYKWGYFTFATFGFILEAVQLLYFFRNSAIETGFSKAGAVLTFSSSLLLMLYPLAWGLSYGGNVIQPDSEAVFFGVLDVCFFVILGAAFIYFTSGINYSSYGFATLGRPVLHCATYARPGSATVSSPAAKEAAIDNNRHSGETAADHHPTV